MTAIAETGINTPLRAVEPRKMYDGSSVGLPGRFVDDPAYYMDQGILARELMGRSGVIIEEVIYTGQAEPYASIRTTTDENPDLTDIIIPTEFDLNDIANEGQAVSPHALIGRRATLYTYETAVGRKPLGIHVFPAEDIATEAYPSTIIPLTRTPAA